MKEPLVSIICPVYNAEKYVKECIDSVKNQSYKNYTMYLVDDGSTDASVKIINQEIANDTRFILLQTNKNEGAAVARNLAIEKARGRYIAFLDSDDVWLEQKLEVQIAFMETKKIDFSFSSYAIMIEHLPIVGEFIIPQKVLHYSDLLKTCSIGCLTAVYNQESLGKHYMKLIDKRQDYALWLELLKKTDANGLKEVLAIYRKSKASLSGNKWQAAKYQWYVYRNVEKLPLVDSIYYFLNYAIAGFIKHLRI